LNLDADAVAVRAVGHVLCPCIRSNAVQRIRRSVARDRTGSRTALDGASFSPIPTSS
jgi:hypothetical protein